MICYNFLKFLSGFKKNIGNRSLYSSLAISRSCSQMSTKSVEEMGVRKITLCNTKTRNALSLLTLNELIEHVTVNNESSTRCITIQAEGPVFSSGHNLKEFDMDSEHKRRVFSACSELMMHIVKCPVPVIAVVDGLAAAAGCQLVAQCDIALCTPTSTFSTPGANFGLFCSTPGIAVARTVGRKTALKMLLTGLPISAEEAYLSGLVSKVVTAELIDQELKTITDAIQSKSRSVISLGKRFFYHQIEKDLYTAYRLGEQVMVDNLSLKDGKEGITSFIEKRKPVWDHSTEKASES